MPLEKGKSKKIISKIISELYHANKSKSAAKKRSRKQIIAIALSSAKKSKKKR